MQLEQEPPYILDVALMVYFAVFLAVYMELGQYLLINGLLNITIHGWLAFVMLVSHAMISLETQNCRIPPLPLS